jgi:hypothetical protein
VTVHLEKLFDGPVVSFGVPVPPGKVVDPGKILVSLAGQPIAISTKVILWDGDAAGAPTRPLSILVQFPSTALPGASADVDIVWSGGTAGSAGEVASYASASAPSPEVVRTAERTIVSQGGTNQIVETSTGSTTLFTGREPMVLATFPPGYLARTGILGAQVTNAEAAQPEFAGLTYLSENLSAFALSAMYAETYAVDAYKDPKDAYAGAVVDAEQAYEGWLYDRCATFLTAHLHDGDTRFLRHALRSCSYYGSKVNLEGPNAGIWSGKAQPDAKYSHLRGLYAYYALTGDETALAAGKAIADMWYADPLFVVPYRQGHTRGPDKLWTERLLGTSLEGLYYGARLTGDAKYLRAFSEMFETAYRHITGDAAALGEINPGYRFPPQNCFVHSGLQHEGDGEGNPWCSGWMAELVIDPLLRYQQQTGDDRVDEVFVRLARFLRDVGSSYFQKDPLKDSFLAPSACYDPSAGDAARRLVPLYGAGIAEGGARSTFGEWDDFEHCADATALTAAAIRGLKRQGRYEQGGPIGPFASEGESFLQMHHEFSACAKTTFHDWTRPKRDPKNWTSAELAAGLGNPAKFIHDNKIGFPSHASTPLRKLSWWFNTSMLQFGLFREAGVPVGELHPGAVQKAGCP